MELGFKLIAEAYGPVDIVEGAAGGGGRVRLRRGE